MNESILFVKRQTRTTNHRTYNSPIIKMEIPDGRFLISQKLADLLDVNTDDGLMFGFNKKNKTAYIIKDNEPDAFILRRKDKNSLRFTSKDLMIYFLETFEISTRDSSTFYFNVSLEANEKGLRLITWDN